MKLYTCKPIVRAMGEEKASQTGHIAAVIVSIIMLGAFFVYVSFYHNGDDPDGPGGGGYNSGGECPNWTVEEMELLESNDYMADNSEEEESFVIDTRRPVELRVNLTWVDEEPSGVRWTNEPDTFNMTLFGPTGMNDTVSGDSGFLELVVPLNTTGDMPTDWNGEWRVVLALTTGDQHSGEGFRIMVDTGNTYVLNATMSYHCCNAL